MSAFTHRSPVKKQKSQMKAIDSPLKKPGVMMKASDVAHEKVLANLSLDDLVFSKGKCLGQGTYGEVQLAEHAPTETPLAVKIVKKA
jgi:serine/threonine protein kinase